MKTEIPNSSSCQQTITIRDLSISFGKQKVLDSLSMDLHKGENLIVLGRSGSGKSVLIKCIARLLAPDRGVIQVDGQLLEDISEADETAYRKRLGFLFQSGALYDSMTVRENLEFPLKRYYKKIKKDELEERASKALENVGLKDVLDKMPSELSGGMRKRVALARTIIVDPNIMLYDEPTTGLDPITSAEISELINEVRAKYHTSSIIITHDIPCARKVADRVIMLKDGHIAAQGSFNELENSDDPWVHSFFLQ